ncbi:immunity 49 family protein [Streptomyces sp. NPDC048416]|uniref:immunity 49 family protein n=1 Tax=Streptomyces sp. NPDC048416 TaxID=3365546 RepID=UPI003712AF11
MISKDVTRHDVTEQRIEQALQDMESRVFDFWHDQQYDGSVSLRYGLIQLEGELLDHTGARTLEDPALRSPEARTVLLTAAECALQSLALGCFPDGDWEVELFLADRTLSSDDLCYDERWEPDSMSTSARDWTRAFSTCVVSGLVWQHGRVIGPMLRNDFAPAIRDGVPYSQRQSTSGSADLAEMDALCAYLHDVDVPASSWAASGPSPLRRPAPAERAGASRQLDAAGPLTPDQRLLRVLLDDDQDAFERALEKRLLEHRANIDPDPAPHTLFPLGSITLAALATLAHGWQLSVQSDYLPTSLLCAPAEVTP